MGLCSLIRVSFVVFLSLNHFKNAERWNRMLNQRMLEVIFTNFRELTTLNQLIVDPDAGCGLQFVDSEPFGSKCQKLKSNATSCLHFGVWGRGTEACRVQSLTVKVVPLKQGTTRLMSEHFLSESEHFLFESDHFYVKQRAESVWGGFLQFVTSRRPMKRLHFDRSDDFNH